MNLTVNKDFGEIINPSTKERKKISVQNDQIDASILIGIGLANIATVVMRPTSFTRWMLGLSIMNVGLLLAMTETYYRGANQFWKGETRALIELGLFGDDDINDYRF